jgi:hypothetical protein
VTEQLSAVTASVVVLLRAAVGGVEAGVATASSATAAAAAEAAKAAASEASAQARWAAWAEATAARGAATGWAASPTDRASASRWSTGTAAVVASRVASVATAVVVVGGCRRRLARRCALGRVFPPGVARSPRVRLPAELVLEVACLVHKVLERVAESLHAALGLGLEPSEVVACACKAVAEVALCA